MPGPTVRRRQLGRVLRQFRDQAGRPAREVAEWLDISTATLSKVENGRQAAKIAHVRLLLQLYDVDSAESDEVVRLTREANQRGWWTEYGDTVPGWFRDYLGMESDAAELWTYEAELIHGLLRTSDYDHALRAAVADDPNSGALDRFAALRKVRQDRLNGEQPPNLVAVASEGALRRVVGGPEVMRKQLEHLIAVAALPHVTFQVLSFDAGAHPAMNAPFTLLRFAQDLEMDAAYLENDLGAVYVERPTDVRHYAEAFRQLRKQALTPKKSRDLLTHLARSL